MVFGKNKIPKAPVDGLEKVSPDKFKQDNEEAYNENEGDQEEIVEEEVDEDKKVKEKPTKEIKSKEGFMTFEEAMNLHDYNIERAMVFSNYAKQLRNK